MMATVRWLVLFLGLCLAATADAQAFSLTDSKGNTLRLSDFRGKWVLVNFWATWCPPCLEEMPDLGSLYDARKDADLAVIGVAVDFRNAKEVLDFADTMLVSYPIVLGDQKIKDQFGRIRGLPTTFIYNPDGKLVKTHVGAIKRKEIEALIATRR